MNRHFLLLLSIFISSLFPALAQTQLDSIATREKIEAITSEYNDWETVELSGKVKMAGLPVTPSFRLFMVRDTLVRLSVKAPFVGEVARAEITDSTLLFINKMNKTYILEPMVKLKQFYPGGLEDLQNIIINRMVLPGYGPLTPDLAGETTIETDGEGWSILSICDDIRPDNYSYAYLLDPSDNFNALVIYPDGKEDTNVQVIFTLNEGQYEIQTIYSSAEKYLSATLECTSFQWGAKGFGETPVSSKYRQVSLQQFLKAF